jgi:hypothetical protein
MKTEAISIIWIDDSNRLCIQPDNMTFEMIYRSAMGVQWNTENRHLYSQVLNSGTPIDWFHQILAAVEIEYGYRLCITEKTKWKNIDTPFKMLIETDSMSCYPL